jgi:hypothetical protein
LVLVQLTAAVLLTRKQEQFSPVQRNVSGARGNSKWVQEGLAVQAALQAPMVSFPLKDETSQVDGS